MIPVGYPEQLARLRARVVPLAYTKSFATVVLATLAAIGAPVARKAKETSSTPLFEDVRDIFKDESMKIPCFRPYLGSFRSLKGCETVPKGMSRGDRKG